MKGVDKDKKQLVDELGQLRQRIAELEASESERNKTEVQYRLLIDNAAEAIAVLQDGRIKFANPKLTEITGYTIEELTSVPFVEHVHPDERDKVIDYRNRRLKGENVPQTYSLRIIDKAGNTKWLERKVTLINWEGRPAALILDTDITGREMAEEALQASEARYRAVLENANEIIVVVQDNMSKYSNPKAAEVTGYSQEELTSRPFIDFVHPDDHQTAAENYSMRLKGDWSTPGKPVRIVTKDGDARLMEFSGSEITWGGRPAILYLVNDVTEQKRMEETLRESESRYRGLAESITDIFFAMDEKLRYTYWNKASEKVTGILAKEALGKRITDIFPDDEATGRAADVYRAALATGEPQYFTNNFPIGGRDFVFDISVYPTTGGIAVYAKDVTERKKLEDALTESEQWYRYLFDNAPFGIGFSSLDGKVINMNEAMETITGYSAEEIANINLADTYVNKADREQLLRKVRQHGGIVDYPVQLKRKDGTVYDALLSSRLINIGDKEFIQTIYHDITERKRAEEALRESEERYRALVEMSPEAIFVASEGKHVFANTAGLKLLGASSLDQLIGIPLMDVIHPDYREIVAERIREAAKTGTSPTVMEEKFIRLDGTVIDVEVRGAPLIYQGKPAMQVVVRDIAERKRAEEALRLSERNFRDSIENSPLGIRIVSENGKTLYANRALLALYGYSSLKELVSVPTKQRYIPESYDEHRKRVEKRKRGEYVPPNYEISIVRSDGQVRNLAVSRGEVLWNGERQFQVLYQDITEHKRAEEALRASEERYRLLAENMRDVILALDMDLRFIYVSPSVKSLGDRTAEQVMSEPLENLLTSSSLNLARDVLTEELALADIMRRDPTRSRTLEVEVIRSDGSILCAELKMSFLRDQNGQPVGVLGVMRDITERKLIEEERRALEQKAQLASHLASVGELSAGIAHEINNPLTGVIGYAELLLQEDIPKHIRSDVEVVHDGARRVADVVKGLLTFARQTKPERTVVDINQIVEVVLRLRAYELETGNIKVTTKLAPDLPITIADAGQLQQVFLNLIINAETEMRSAHGKGKLTIRTEHIDDTIRVSFKDDGPGIAEENLRRIFDPFFTTRDTGKGTGLGLSICHGIVTEHKGRVYVESELGKGATFIVELPVITEKERSKRAKTERKQKKVTGAKILVVDDEPVVRRLLSQVLTEEGHVVEATGDAKDVLNRIKNDGYSLILLDMRLPGMSGSELYERIKEIESSLAKRVVFITGDVMGTETEAFLAKTKMPYITKPFDVKELGAEIRRLLTVSRRKGTAKSKQSKTKG